MFGFGKSFESSKNNEPREKTLEEILKETPEDGQTELSPEEKQRMELAYEKSLGELGQVTSENFTGETVDRPLTAAEKKEMAAEYNAAIASLEQEMTIDTETGKPAEKQSYEGGIDFDPTKVAEKSGDVWEDPLANKDVGKMDWEDRKAA